MDSVKIKSPKTAFFASIIPGGGQIYNGKLVKGVTVMGLQALAIKSWLENSKIYSDYDTGDYLLRKSRYLSKRNKYAWWVIFLYFYGMIDAIVDAHLSPFDDVMDANIENAEQGVENE
jgi:hypothetical protein